jgi:hypothetical protein
MEAQYLQHKQSKAIYKLLATFNFIFLEGQGGSIVIFPMIPNPLKSSIIINKIPKKFKNENEENIELMAVGTHMPIESAEMLFPGSVNW